MNLDDYPRIGDWLALGADRLLVRTGKVDIGQRISTALAGIVEEELTLPQSSIAVQPVRTGESPDEGMTSGSNSIEQSGRAVRLAAATLRRLILAHAAETMGGAPEDWRLEAGMVSGPGSNRPVPVLDLARQIDLDQPVATDLPPAPRGAPRSLPMRGLEDLVTGRFRFIHDIELDGMLHARVIRPPHARARLAGIAEGAVERLADEGFAVVRDGSFLA
ncbi:MAG: xanthine dehydrogenase family protein molybdopterin-binding subunit, partial [Alphaproteobacteria bacterium]